MGIGKEEEEGGGEELNVHVVVKTKFFLPYLIERVTYVRALISLIMSSCLCKLYVSCIIKCLCAW